MTSFTKKSLASVFIFTLSSMALATTLHPVPRNADSLSWMNLPSLPGTTYAILAGDPLKKEFFTVRLKFPANYKVAPHYHPITEYDTVISGIYHVGTGKKFRKEPEQSLALSPGTFLRIPANTFHYGWTTDETVLQISGIGPWGAIYASPLETIKK